MRDERKDGTGLLRSIPLLSSMVRMVGEREVIVKLIWEISVSRKVLTWDTLEDCSPLRGIVNFTGSSSDNDTESLSSVSDPFLLW